MFFLKFVVVMSKFLMNGSRRLLFVSVVLLWGVVNVVILWIYDFLFLNSGDILVFGWFFI